MMMRKQFSGLTLMVLGTLALLQALGVYYFGLAFVPALVLYIGLEITWGSLFDRWHGRPSIFGAALGLFVAAWGLVQILSNAGLAVAMSAGDLIRVGWPILLVAFGLSLLFGRKSWEFRR